MTDDPFERTRILEEAEDERVKAAKAQIKDADVERCKRSADASAFARL